jgi:hypothetical protein
MGAVAQGQRFGTTILLNEYMQGLLKLSKRDEAAAGGGSALESNAGLLLSFSASMLAAGLGEALANPPVVVKNYQIAHGRGVWAAAGEVYAMNGPQGFFRGVVAGVARKSLANAIVLQTIAPCKEVVNEALFSGGGGGGGKTGESSQASGAASMLTTGFIGLRRWTLG